MDDMTTIKQFLKIIRRTCLRCCCGSTISVKECMTENSKNMYPKYEVCPLFPFRMGIDTEIKKKPGSKINSKTEKKTMFTDI